MKNKFTKLFLLAILLSNTIFSQEIQINKSKEYQTIDGFGGFGAKKVWWDSPPFHDQEYINTAVDVMGCNIIRTQLYFDFEPANDNNDPNVLDESKLRFGTTSDNGKQFSFIKDIAAKGVKIIVSVWTPPSWMKDFSDPKTIPDECYNCWNCPKPWSYPIPENRKMCGGVLRTDMYEEYAEYLVAYIKIVKRQTGVDVYGLSIQNEPLFANPFEAAVLKPEPYAKVLKVVGDRFKKEGLTTKFFGPEHMGEYTWVPGNKEYVNQLFKVTTSGKEYLDMYSVHGYLDGVANDFGSAEGWTNLYNNITVAHGKPLWMTETGNQVPNTFDQGFKFATAMHLALKFGHISGWVFWGLAGNAINGNTLTNTGAAMKLFYKYIKPGYINIEATSTDKDLLITAYKKDNNLVVVIINNGTSSKTAQLNLGSAALPNSFEVYRYSQTQLGVALGTVSNNSFNLPSKTVTTLVYEDKATSNESGIEVSNSQLNIYPTEVYFNEVNIELSGNSKMENVDICSIDGRIARNYTGLNLNKMTINTEGLSKGMYIIKVTTSQGVKSKKINIQ
ncbi:MAG: T9SS C-terminal target domain-containing protein [Cytophagales bacterium]|nr:MAG: T9SS C-terminal target domain-containing protein [Cytophagales bacterium]